MEVFKDLNSQKNKDFETLLNSQLSKTKIEEGKIINGVVTKLTPKFCFLFVEGLKSEPVLDRKEVESLNLIDKINYFNIFVKVSNCPILKMIASFG